MKRLRIALAGLVAGGFALTAAQGLLPVRRACAAQLPPSYPLHPSYSEDIAPALKGWCASCHQPGGEGFEKSGLDLTTYEGLMKGTKYGPMVIAGKPEESNLLRLINGEAKIQMPLHHKPLPSCVRVNIWSWVFEGAKNN
jgi:Planctomycete cytochrome C